MITLVVAQVKSGAAQSQSGPAFGVAEDAPQYAADGGSEIDASLHQLGMTEDRWTVNSRATLGHLRTRPLSTGRYRCRRERDHDHIVVYFQPIVVTGSDELLHLGRSIIARRYPTITSFIVGNEVNSSRFWSPPAHRHRSGRRRRQLRIGTGAMLRHPQIDKPVDPSDRHGTRAAGDRHQLDPATHFLREVGAAYRASGRTTPIMDELAIHAYPDPNQDPPPPPDDATYADTGFYGIPQLDRVKQAVWDAFEGTPQPRH